MFCTFIIPTLNRISLRRTLLSLVQQSDPDWNAIVIGDGVIVTEIVKDLRIIYINHEKFEGGAGIVRNFGLDMVHSSWVAFVDDDDYLSPKYVSEIRRLSNDWDVIQFSYRDVETGRIQPPPHLNHLVECDMGISFSIRTDFMQKNKIRFTKGGIEDFRFLDECIKKGARYLITHSVIYFVGHRSVWS